MKYKKNARERGLSRVFGAAIMSATLVGLTTVAIAHSGQSRTDVVRTSDGPIKGIKKDGMQAYLGIPFAAPPVGNLRWRPPQSPRKWQRARDTVAYEKTCVQTNTLGVFAAPSINEDCLYLNVFVPDRGRKSASPYWNHHRRLPVMVWIHGGGLFDGSANEYDPQKLATEGDVVVVTTNYRLNVFGFLAHPALDSEGHAFGNYGYMDQQFALKWVQRNISAFGGDPRNVTIFGESAGGNSVLAAMASPTAKGLFHRVVAQSGSYVMVSKERTLADARTYGQQFAAAAGCTDQTAACLRSLTPEQIVARTRAYTDTAVTMIDGIVLKNAISDTLQSGRFNRVPVINGSTRDELTWFVGLTELATGHVVTAAEYPASVGAMFGAANAPRILAQYRLADYNSPSEALAAMQTAQLMACPQRTLNRVLAKYVPIYGFEFADRTAPSAGPVASFPYGAAHTFEIQYLFEDYHGATGTIHPLNSDQSKLSDDMVSYWTTFAKTGDPNARGTPNWNRYDSRKDKYQSLQLPSPKPTSDFSDEHKCDFWDDLAANPGS